MFELSGLLTSWTIVSWQRFARVRYADEPKGMDLELDFVFLRDVGGRLSLSGVKLSIAIGERVPDTVCTEDDPAGLKEIQLPYPEQISRWRLQDMGWRVTMTAPELTPLAEDVSMEMQVDDTFSAMQLDVQIDDDDLENGGLPNWWEPKEGEGYSGP